MSKNRESKDRRTSEKDAVEAAKRFAEAEGYQFKDLISAGYASPELLREELGFAYKHGRYVVHMTTRKHERDKEVVVRVEDDGDLTCRFVPTLG